MSQTPSMAEKKNSSIIAKLYSSQDRWDKGGVNERTFSSCYDHLDYSDITKSKNIEFKPVLESTSTKQGKKVLMPSHNDSNVSTDTSSTNHIYHILEQDNSEIDDALYSAIDEARLKKMKNIRKASLIRNSKYDEPVETCLGENVYSSITNIPHSASDSNVDLNQDSQRSFNSFNKFHPKFFEPNAVNQRKPVLVLTIMLVITLPLVIILIIIGIFVALTGQHW